MVREDHLVLESHSNPEGGSRDRRLAVVHPALHDDPHPEHEQEGEQDRDVGRGHGARDRQQERGHLGQERRRREHDPDPHADAARGDAGQLGDRDARRVGRVRHRAGEAGEQVAGAVRGHRALHRPEVHRARLAPGDPLDGDGVADRFGGADQGHEDERRKQSPERSPELQIESRISPLRISPDSCACGPEWPRSLLRSRRGGCPASGRGGTRRCRSCTRRTGDGDGGRRGPAPAPGARRR